MSGHETTLRRLTLRDDAYIDGLLADERRNAVAFALDGRRALVQIAALIAVDATPPCYMEAIAAARQWDATTDEIVGCLIAVLSVVGVARVVSAAPKVGLALGYDVDSALELLGPLDDDDL